MAEVKKNKILKDARHEDEEEDFEHRSFRVTKGVVRGQVNGFMGFIREQGVVGLAVGLTLGTAVTVFVKSLVDNIITPVIGTLLPGSQDLASKSKCLDYVNGVCTNKLGWGTVLSNLISFVTIAGVVYFVVHGLKLDKLDKKKEK